jgi:hypothetical protein
MFRFYIDNALMPDPVNWGDFTETIERADDIKGLLPKYELQLSFMGEAYGYLYEVKNTCGYCCMVELRVERECGGGNWDVVLNGYIAISRCIFHVNDCVVDCDIIDNNYGALIFNNKSIKTSIASDKSKTGETITPATSSLLLLFNPSTGTYTITSDARESYNVYEAFKYLIAFMTDDKVGFESDFLTNYIQLYLMTGRKLRTNDSGNYPIISFSDLFQEVSKKFNIGFTVVNRAGKPTIKIENIEYFYQESVAVSIQNIPDLIEKFNPELLYSGIKLGGTTANFDPLIHSIAPRQFQGYELEEYYFGNQCNIDSQLDLSGNWIVDCNVIQELAYTNQTNEDYDKDIILIVGAESAGYVYSDKEYSPINLAWQYNFDLTNEKASTRYNFYGNTTLYSGLETNSFRAERTNYVDTGNLATAANGWNNPDFYQGDLFGLPACGLQTSGVITTLFNDDSTPPNFDTGLNYNPANGQFTAPLEGSYSFEYTARFKVLSQPPSTIQNRKCRFTVYLRRYNALNVLQEEFTEVRPSATGFANLPFGTYPLTIEKYFYMDATDYVIAAAQMESECDNPLLNNSALYVNVTNGSYFKAIGTPSGGGVFEGGDADEYKVSLAQFEAPMSNETYDTLKSDLTQGVRFNHDGISNKTGWLRKVVRNYKTGLTKFELISNKRNIT